MPNVRFVVVALLAVRVLIAAPAALANEAGTLSDGAPPTPSLPPPSSGEPSPLSEEAAKAAAAKAEKLVDDRLAEEVAALSGFRVPDNPALHVLGSPDLEVARPGSVADLGTDLRALYKDGKVVPQIAIEFSPYALTLGRRTTFRDYLDHGYIRALQRFTVSIATTSIGEDDGQTTLGALGARIRLIDDSDWRLDAEAVDCALVNSPNPRDTKPPAYPRDGAVIVVPQTEDEKVAKKAEEQRAKVTKCFEDRPKQWNARQLAIGGALSSAFPGGDLRWDVNDLSGWISYAMGLGDATSLVVSGKYLFNDVQRKGEVLQRARHTAALGLQLEHRGTKYGVLLKAGFGSRWNDDAVTEAWAREWIGLFGGEAQLRIGADTWLSMSFSGELVEGEGDQLVSLANFKWNYDLGAKKGD